MESTASPHRQHSDLGSKASGAVPAPSRLAAQKGFRSQVNRSYRGWSEGQSSCLAKQLVGADRRNVWVSLTRQPVAYRAARQSLGSWFAERFSHRPTRGRAALESARPAFEPLNRVER